MKSQSKMKVKPAPGLQVRHPDTQAHIPKDGAEVLRDNYWLRRLASGDVVLVEAKPKSKPK